MREVPRHLFVRDHLREPGLRRPRPADRRGADDLAAVRRGADDRAARGRARAQGARDRHRLGLPDRDPRPAGALGLQPRADPGARAPGDPRACASSASTTSRSRPSTAPWAGARWRPFDRILVTAGAPAAPKPLLEQLAPKGRLLVPGGRPPAASGWCSTSEPARGVRRREVEEVAFVPLVGRHGWSRRAPGRERCAASGSAAGCRASDSAPSSCALARARDVAGGVRNEPDGSVDAAWRRATRRRSPASRAGLARGPRGGARRRGRGERSSRLARGGRLRLEVRDREMERRLRWTI